MGKAVAKTRSSAAKPAILAPEDMKAVTARRRAVIDIRRPHVEGHRGHLEAEAHQEQGRADSQQQRSGPAAAAARIP